MNTHPFTVSYITAKGNTEKKIKSFTSYETAYDYAEDVLSALRYSAKAVLISENGNEVVMLIAKV